MFKNNNTPYDVRATMLEQPLRRTTDYGLRTLCYIGSRLWNLLVHMDLGQFKSLLKQWTGPKCDVSEMRLLYVFSTMSLFTIFMLDIYLIVHFLNMHPYL